MEELLSKKEIVSVAISLNLLEIGCEWGFRKKIPIILINNYHPLIFLAFDCNK